MNTIDISVPDGHIVVGYVAHLKVLDEIGNLYFGLRSKDVNDMEALGLAVDMVNSFQDDLQSGKERA
jgi:hypothetical protein